MRLGNIISILSISILGISTNVHGQQNMDKKIVLPNQTIENIKIVQDDKQHTFIIGFNAADELCVSVIDSTQHLILNTQTKFLSIGVKLIRPLSAHYSDNHLNIYNYIENNGVATLQQLQLNPFTLEIVNDNYIQTIDAENTIPNIRTYKWLENNNNVIVATQTLIGQQELLTYQFLNNNFKINKTIYSDTSIYQNIAILQENFVGNDLIILAKGTYKKDGKTALIYARINEQSNYISFQKVEVPRSEDVIIAALTYDSRNATYHLISSKMKTLQKDDKHVQLNTTWTSFNADTTIHQLLRYPTFKPIKRKSTTDNTVYALLPQHFYIQDGGLNILFEEWIIDKKDAEKAFNNEYIKDNTLVHSGIVAMAFDSNNVASNISYLPYFHKGKPKTFNTQKTTNAYYTFEHSPSKSWYNCVANSQQLYIIEDEANAAKRTQKQTLSAKHNDKLVGNTYDLDSAYIYQLIRTDKEQIPINNESKDSQYKIYRDSKSQHKNMYINLFK